MSDHDQFTPTRFPVELPPFADWRRRLLALGGSVTQVAATVVFDEMKTEVNVYEDSHLLEPQAYPWARPGRGTILAGCHRNGGEAFFLAALLGDVPGKELRVYAKPYGLLAQGIRAVADPRRRQHSQWYAAGISQRAMAILAPVVPGKLDRTKPTDPGNIRDRLFWWLGMRQRLPDPDAIAAVNARSRKTMNDCIEQGGAGLIFPVGRIGDVAKSVWRKGIGEAVLGVNQGLREETDIVHFRFHDFSARAVAMAVLFGRKAPAEPVRLDIARPYTAAEAIACGGTDPVELTAYMQQRYITHFTHNNPVQ